MPGRKTRVRLQRAVLYQFDRTRTRGGVRDDLVGVTVHHKDRHADLLQIIRVVLPDELGNTVVLPLCAAHHALAPPVRDDRLGRLDARLAEVVERPGRYGPVELRAVRRELRLQGFEGRLGTPTGFASVCRTDGVTALISAAFATRLSP